MPISYNDISSTLRLPLFWAEVDPSKAGTFANYQRAIVFGYKLASESGDANTQVRISSADQAKSLWGRGSQIAGMFETWFANNAFSEVWAMAIDPPSAGTAATGTIAVAGPATGSGVIYLYIGGRRVSVNVVSGDADTAIAAAIATAINAMPDLPVTASATLADVTLTAKWKGLDGNAIDIRTNYLGSLGGEVMPAGVALTITAMASGAGVPDLNDAFAALGDEEFDTVVIPWTDTATLNAVDAEWDHVGSVGRWTWLRQIYGHVYTAADGSVGTLQTFGSARNGAHVTCWGYNSSPSPVWRRAAAYGAQAHSHILNDPARPLHTLPLNDILPAVQELRFTKGEKNSLAFDGISCAKETEDGRLQIETSFSMYQKNTHGLDDNAFLKVQTLATLAYVLRSLRFAIVQKFPRHKLANDGTRYGPGQAIVTPKVARAEIVAHYRQLEYRGMVENMEQFKAHLIVERNADDPNRLDVLYPPDLVNQLDVFAVLAQFRLQYPQTLPNQPLQVA